MCLDDDGWATRDPPCTKHTAQVPEVSFLEKRPTSEKLQKKTKPVKQKTQAAAEVTVKGKGFPYSIPSVGPEADPGVQAVSLQVTVSHPPGGRLPLLSARPAVTSPAAEHHRPLAGTKLYCLVTEAHR